MRRFRFTVAVICLVLLYLGGNDLLFWGCNQQPVTVRVEALATAPPPQEWLVLEGGYLDLLEAISTSGTIEVEAFLVPYRQFAGDDYRVMVETRDPAIVDTLTTYHFKLDSAREQADYRQQHPGAFELHRPVTGTVIGGLIRNNNKQRLQRLTKEFGVEVPDEVVFISEGKEPPFWRGFFFFCVGLLGMGKVVLWKRKTKVGVNGSGDLPGSSDQGAA
ncbi:MAG: hypothetical protein C0616_14290 [Desulfuromonas sp.]|nr:MAG: hypothetical protein C0616_14290 [Desulfuromonas sp.]